MGQYVTATGFKRRTLLQIKQDLETELKAVFGPSFETAPESPNGYLVAMLAKSLSSLQELGQEIYDAHNPITASGLSLDYILSIVGMARRAATPCRGPVVCYTDQDSLTLPAGSSVMRQRGALRFTLDQELTISGETALNSVTFAPDSAPSQGPHLFVFDFGTYSPTGATSAAILAGLKAMLDASASFGGTATMMGTSLRIDRPTAFDVQSFPDVAKVSGRGVAGNFTAVSTGYQTADVGEVRSVVSSIDGWTGCDNLEALTPGADYESDTETLTRFYAHVDSTKGNATDDAIAAQVRDNVPGVTLARVKSNRLLTTDADGRPGKSFETLVVGGEDLDVAQAIYKSQAAGIQSYGNTSVTFLDANGDEQLIQFSRPVPKYLWIKVTGSLYSEEDFPGVDVLKQAILDWSSGEYTMGKDVIQSRVAVPVGQVPGIGNVTIQAALSDTPTGTHTYTATAIPVGLTEYAVASLDRMEVTLA